MGEYRIIKHNRMFIVQRRGWLGWRDINSGKHVCLDFAESHKKECEHRDQTGDYEVVG